MAITEQKSNEIKLKIIKQLKDPTSALNALLGRKDYLDIEGP